MDDIGKKWHPANIHRLLQNGALRFNELNEEVGGITNKMLSQNLEDLEEKQLVDRDIVSEKPAAVEYALTERGQSLETAIESLEEWGRRTLDPPRATANLSVSPGTSAGPVSDLQFSPLVSKTPEFELRTHVASIQKHL